MMVENRKKILAPSLLKANFIPFVIFIVLLFAGFLLGILENPVKSVFIPIIILVPEIIFFSYKRIKLSFVHLVIFGAYLFAGLVSAMLSLNFPATCLWVIGVSIFSGILSIPMVSKAVSGFLKKLSIQDYTEVSQEFGNVFALTIGVCVSSTTVSGSLLLISTFIAGRGLIDYIIVALLTFVLGIISAISIFSKVRGATDAISKGFSEIEKGNYSFSLECQTPDECGKMFITFNRMSEKISKNIETLKKTEESLKKALSELSTLFFSDIKEVNNGIAYLNETLGILEQTGEMLGNLAEIGTRVYNKNEENYRKMIGAIENFRTITDYMNTLKISISSLGETSKFLEAIKRKTSSIVKSIREISNQIQILAVNAEIEAADAGEYGKRFMVIAEEIRRLAEKSTDITAGVEESLDSIVGKVGEIRNSIERIEEILKANEEEMKEASRTIDVSIEYLDDIKNGVEEIFNTIEEMKSSGETISKSVKEGNETLMHLGEKLLALQENIKEIEALVREIEKNGRTEEDIQE